ncbi:helix-turn-helix domain-containing protein [Corynebacterium phoceense]|uniref:helix-turn-helix domain-containing protein n=1 Tax=Corynebacterium phoceense TaxID=1686286 RepID=UPI000839C9AF|nr:helix-turn-helix transcriptional regulator [Corynebacterium phoceense]
MPAQKRLVDTYPDWPDTDPEDVRNAVHRRLLLLAKSLRNEVGKNGSVRYVAERSHVSHTMITRFIRGESIPRVDTIMAIEEFVETSVWPERETIAKPVELPEGSWTR